MNSTSKWFIEALRHELKLDLERYNLPKGSCSFMRYKDVTFPIRYGWGGRDKYFWFEVFNKEEWELFALSHSLSVMRELKLTLEANQIICSKDIYKPEQPEPIVSVSIGKAKAVYLLAHELKNKLDSYLLTINKEDN